MLILRLSLSWYNSLLFFPFIYLFGRGCVCYGTYVGGWTENNVQHSILFSYPQLGSRGWTQVTMPDSKGFYPLSQLINPDVLLMFSEGDILTMRA